MGKARTALQLVVSLAIAIGIIPFITFFYLFFTGQDLPFEFKVFASAFAFAVAWVIISALVFSIRRTERKKLSRILRR